MKISKQDALIWFIISRNYRSKRTSTKHEEIIYATFAQIEAAVDQRNETLMAEIKNLKTLENRTYFVGKKINFLKDAALVCLGPV